jgi:hypothetical protein
MGVITAGDALWDVLPEEWRREMPRRVRAGSIAAMDAAKSAPKAHAKGRGKAKGAKRASKQNHG